MEKIHCTLASICTGSRAINSWVTMFLLAKCLRSNDICFVERLPWECAACSESPSDTQPELGAVCAAPHHICLRKARAPHAVPAPSLCRRCSRLLHTLRDYFQVCLAGLYVYICTMYLKKKNSKILGSFSHYLFVVILHDYLVFLLTLLLYFANFIKSGYQD